MRLLHTMLRVGDLQRSIDFYTQVLGMKLLRTTERPEQKYSLAFVGYGTNPEHAEIELTYNHGVSTLRDGHGLRPHRDRRARRRRAPASGSARPAATSRASPARSRAARTVIAFVTDPDGYKIELIERPNSELPPELLSGSLDRRGIHYAWVVAAVTFLAMLTTSAALGLPGAMLQPLEQGVRLEHRADVVGAGGALRAVRPDGAVRGRADGALRPARVMSSRPGLIASGAGCWPRRSRSSGSSFMLWGLVLGWAPA